MGLSAQVIIIGGGIQGISLAYHLAQRGLSDVRLVEMKLLGSGSSGLSASVIGHAFPGRRSLPLTRWSFDALMRFEDEVGADPGYEPIGILLLAGPRADELRERHSLLQGMGVECDLVEAEAILGLTPGLNLEGIRVGLYLPRDGVLDPHSIMMGYAAEARRKGVHFMEGVEATGLEVRGDRVTGVHTATGTIASETVVNAAGARAREVAAWAGMDLPITNLKRHILVTGPVPAYSQAIPFTHDWEQVWYMRREGPGLLMGMGTEESDWDDLRVDDDFLEEIIDHAIFRAPALAEAGLMTSWAGLRPVTPDDDPILGRAAHLRNFINDCGWGGHGVMNAPAAGMALAELIVDGATKLVDMSHFRAERFEVSAK